MMKAIILAGGENRRIGLNKAFIRLSPSGRTIIENQIKILKEVFEEVLIITNFPPAYKHLGVKLIPDIIPHQGPLGGIYTGLSSSESFHNFFLACDMPFPNINLITYMKDRVTDYDVVVPRTESGYQAVFAFYSKNCLFSLKKQIDSGNLKIADLFSRVKVRTIGPKELTKFDPEEISFFNINTQEDLAKARDRALP